MCLLTPHFQCELRLFAVIEMNDTLADHLIRLMPLAGDDDDVVFRGTENRPFDRSAAVGNPPVLAAARSALDVIEDPLRILTSRVVAGQNQLVRQPRADLSHERPLRLVAITAAAEEQHQTFPLRELTDGMQEFLERVRFVRVVDDDRRTIADALEPSAHRREIANPFFDLLTRTAGGN